MLAYVQIYILLPIVAGVSALLWLLALRSFDRRTKAFLFGWIGLVLISLWFWTGFLRGDAWIDSTGEASMASYFLIHPFFMALLPVLAILRPKR